MKSTLIQRDPSCYDRCFDDFSSACGCPPGGCADGSCGCGAFFCHSWDALLAGGVSETGKNIRLLTENSEEKYGPIVLLKAQMLCGLSLEDMLRRNHNPNDYERGRLERACKQVRNVITSKVASYRSVSSNDSYSRCIGILSGIPGMNELMLQRIGCDEGDLILSLRLKIIGSNESCLRLYEEDLVKRYMNPNWFFHQGPPDAHMLYQVFMELISVLNDLRGHGDSRVMDREIEASVMFLFAVRGFFFVRCQRVIS